MGLEGVELVLAAEETFDVKISDAEASQILTPAELIEFIASHVPTVTTPECITQQLFYRLRRGFRGQAFSLSGRFNLETDLAELVPKNQWDVTWRTIRADSGDANWPESIPRLGFFRDGPKTVRHLIWHLLGSLPRPSPGERWSKVKIEAEVRRIIVEVLGKRDFDLSAKFVGELGVN